MMEKTYPKVAEKPLTLLNVFPSAYLCESAFQVLLLLKAKARNRSLDLDSYLRWAISEIAPRILGTLRVTQPCY